MDVYQSSDSATLPIPTTEGPRDAEIKFAIADLKNDTRTVVVRAQASGVVRERTYQVPNRGNELLIDALTLPSVPGSSSSALVTVTSPNYGGDSVTWSGVVANTFCVADGSGPAVGFATPSDGQTISAGSNVYAKANVSDPDGAAKVDLYLNGSFLRTENYAPYEWSCGRGDSALCNLSAGTYVLEAMATDDTGATGSASITIHTGNP